MALKPRMVVVGLGSIGMRHARLLTERDDVEVEYCDAFAASLDRAEAEIGPRPQHDDFEAMLATRPEHVLIASPHHLHVGQVRAALATGANVLCEKPVSDDLADARSLASDAAAATSILAFGFHLHFHPGIRRMKELADSGALGIVAQFSAHVGSHVTLVNSASRYQATMRGALLLDYTHQADLALMMLGERPAGVYALGLNVPGQELSSSPNVVSMITDYASQKSSLIHLNYLQDPDREDAELIGTEGWVRYDPKSGSLRIGSFGDPVIRKESIRPKRDDIYRAEHDAFFAATRGETDVESPLASALVSLEVAEAALRSMDTRERVPIA